MATEVLACPKLLRDAEGLSYKLNCGPPGFPSGISRAFKAWKAFIWSPTALRRPTLFLSAFAWAPHSWQRRSLAFPARSFKRPRLRNTEIQKPGVKLHSRFYYAKVGLTWRDSPPGSPAPWTIRTAVCRRICHRTRGCPWLPLSRDPYPHSEGRGQSQHPDPSPRY